MSIKSELLDIQAANKDGLLHCHEVVEWARKNSDSALHSAIEWNNRKAADEYRLYQVRQLIRLNIETEDHAPTFVSLSIDRKSGGGYRAVSDVAANKDLREIMLQDALDELERIQAKYARLEALESIWREADQVRQRTGVRRRRQEAPQMAEATA